ncbi:hypothetical protein L1887_12629 [Cichorium endivia]|nr:hypothetical protein L1887_12629 [Cichorium endivia]
MMGSVWHLAGPLNGPNPCQAIVLFFPQSYGIISCQDEYSQDEYSLIQDHIDRDIDFVSFLFLFFFVASKYDCA